MPLFISGGPFCSAGFWPFCSAFSFPPPLPPPWADLLSSFFASMHVYCQSSSIVSTEDLNFLTKIRAKTNMWNPRDTTIRFMILSVGWLTWKALSTTEHCTPIKQTLQDVKTATTAARTKCLVASVGSSNNNEYVHAARPMLKFFNATQYAQA